MAESKKIICGARRKKGAGICQAPPAKGKKRCRLHGGADGVGAPLGNRNAVKHGLYSQYLGPEDQDRWDTIQIGTLDDEIRVTRIQISRCIRELERLDGLASDAGEHMENDTVTMTVDQVGNKITVATKRRKDVLRRYNFLVESVRKLELARLELGGGNKSAEDLARDIGQFMRSTDNPFEDPEVDQDAA